MPLDEFGSRERLAEMLPAFWTATQGGVQDYYDEYKQTAHIHRKTTMRSIMRDHIVHRLRGLINGHVQVEVVDRNQTTYFDCCAQFRVLVKKADEDGLVELAKTQTSFDFQCNEGQYILNPDVIPDVTNLYLSYVPNESDPTMPSVFLICPCAEGWYWKFEIEPPSRADFVDFTRDGGPTPGAGGEETEVDLVRIPPEQKPQSE